MSVLLETSLGDIVIDLYTDEAPNTCLNFLKLCKVKYYNFSPVYNVQKNYTFQTGDPIGPLPSSDGGTSIWGLFTKGPKLFPAEFNNNLDHKKLGTVSMVVSKSSDGKKYAGSQFLMTLRPNLKTLDGKYNVFGQVVEGLEVLHQINDAYCDFDGRPYKDIRILHTIILDDPFPDPSWIVIPAESPPPSPAQLATVRIQGDFEVDIVEQSDNADERRRLKEARAQALTLEIVGDLPSADLLPEENVLFVCKLNPVTTDEDLELIFARFGNILSCRIIRDPKTGDSLQYAFIEFATKESCEEAYFKMDDVLIDDYRIHVDFSQGVNRKKKYVNPSRRRN